MTTASKISQSEHGGRDGQQRAGGRKSAAAGTPEHASDRSRRAKTGTAEQSVAAAAPRPSKQAAVIGLLRRPEGVTVAEVATATGWQPHTVRGLFSGALKRQGLTVISAAEDRGRVYRIVDAAETMHQTGSGS